MAIGFIPYKTVCIFRWTNSHRSTQRVGAKKIERRTKIQESSKRNYPFVHSLSPSISTITPNQEIAKKLENNSTWTFNYCASMASGGELLELRLLDTHLLDTFGSKSIARHKIYQLLESS